jgi:hypothetical protein
MPYDEVPSLRNTSMPGVIGSAVYDTFPNSTLRTWYWVNLTAALCRTTFQPSCDVMPVRSFVDDTAAQRWNATFDDDWTALVDYDAAVSQHTNTSSVLRIVPVPVSHLMTLSCPEQRVPDHIPGICNQCHASTSPICHAASSLECHRLDGICAEQCSHQCEL